MTNKELLKKAEKAINDLYVDTTVSVEVSVNNLQSLQYEINIMLDALND